MFGRCDFNFSLKMGNDELKRYENAKYLGVYLDENINFVTTKLKRLTSAISYISIFIDDIHVNTKYNAYIFPYIKYGIEHYGSAHTKYIKKLQICQNRLLEILYKHDFRDSSSELLKEKIL